MANTGSCNTGFNSVTEFTHKKGVFKKGFEVNNRKVTNETKSKSTIIKGCTLFNKVSKVKQ